MSAWVPWLLRCETWSSMAWDDPMPFLKGTWHRLFSRLAPSGLPLRPAHADPGGAK